MTSLFPPFNRRSSFRKQPYFYEAGRGVNYKSTGGPFPTLDLNFTTGTLDSRITFSRASNATLTDSTGKITYAPANLLTYSEQFDNAGWAKTRTTISANATTAPDGTLTADKLVETATTGPHLCLQSVGTRSGSFIFSVYLKAGERYRGEIAVADSATGSSGFTASFNLNTAAAPITGQYGTGFTVVSASLTSVGSGWYRMALLGIVSSANPQQQIILYDNNGSVSYTGDGTSGFYIWGAQFEPVTYQTTPSTYVATTSSAYYGPRFDYDPITLQCKGLLIEEQRTNLLLRSQEFGGASWFRTRLSVTSSATTSPSGLTDASKLVEDTSTNTHILSASASASAAVHTVSVYLKAAERSWVQLYVDANIPCFAYFNLANGTIGNTGGGATATITLVGNGWYRCTVSGTITASPAVYIVLATGNGTTSYTGDGTSGVFLWGAQLEAGAFATSYIPTVASSVARSADIATMTGTNFSSWFNQGPVNLVLQSQTLENASWTNVSATVTANAAVAPDGTTTAEKLIDSVTNTGHGVAQGVATISGTRYVQSIYAKASERSWMYLTEGNNVTATAYFDLVNGVVGTVTGTGSPSATITSVGNGWYRCSMAFTPISTTSNIQPRVTTGNNVYTYAGDGTSGIFLWGAQLEVGSTATTYIPTTTVPVASPPAVGTMLVQAASFAPQQAVAVRNVVTFNDNVSFTIANLYRIYLYDVVVGGNIRSNSVNQAELTASYAVNVPFKTAFAFATNDVAFTKDGGAVSTDTSSVMPAVNAFQIGSYAGGNNINGWVQSFKYYNQRLPNAKLQALTI